jgi:ubiquitin-conjugating enzyme E2 Z
MNPCIKRIILDIADLQKDPINDIKYYPNEENIMNGCALIIGPTNTPYQYGNYMFSFEFPIEFPYKPPIVTFLSNDGTTRFNPNFYRNGKVCLSILNTWKGEEWSACQSIRSILIILQMTMNDMPLLNEPGVNLTNHQNCVVKYNKIIEYKNIEMNILRYIYEPTKVPIQNTELINDINLYFSKNREEIIKSIRFHLQQEYDNSKIKLDIFTLNVMINYKKLLDQIE